MRRARWLSIVFTLLLTAGCLGNVQVRPVKSFAAIKSGLPEKFVELGGIRLCYSDQGRGSETLLFLPPAMSSIKVWRKVIPAMAKGARVLALDLPGHGKSGKPRRFRYHPETYAEVVVRFLDHLRVSAVTVVGNSNGGATALALALNHPNRVKRLVVLSPAGVRAASPFEQRFLRWSVTRNHLGTMNPTFTKWGLEMLGFGKTGPLSDTYISDLLAIRGAGAEYQAWLRAQVRTVRSAVAYDTSRELGRIKVPLLILWGDKDRLVPVANGRFLRSKVKGSQLVVLPGVGHMPELEVPDAIVKLLGNFMRRTARAPLPRGAPSFEGAGKKSDDDDEGDE